MIRRFSQQRFVLYVRTDIDVCMPQLSEHKERVEKALEVKMMPLEVALECLSLREGRVAIDLVRDGVELQLNKVWQNCHMYHMD